MALKDQPSYIIKMRAKPGMGDRLFELATLGTEKSNSSDRFIMLREDVQYSPGPLDNGAGRHDDAVRECRRQAGPGESRCEARTDEDRHLTATWAAA